MNCNSPFLPTENTPMLSCRLLPRNHTKRNPRITDSNRKPSAGRNSGSTLPQLLNQPAAKLVAGAERLAAHKINFQQLLAGDVAAHLVFEGGKYFVSRDLDNFPA